MIDREKTVKELIEIYNEAYERWVHRPDIEDKLVTLIRDNIPNALALLKKQEPVKPRPISYGIFKCGNCGHWLERIIEVDRYCNQCGRKVLWNG